MWKGIALIFIVFGLLYFPQTFLPSEVMASEQEEVPSYAKWGRMAMEETKRRYPDASIIDYLYIGREPGKERTIEKFKLWLRGEEKEFGLYISIEFDTETENNITWTFTETDR